MLASALSQSCGNGCKTGTTSVQTALTENAERLAPHLRVLLKPDFKPLTDAARACSVAPGDQSVAAVGRRAARVFRRLDRDDPRPVVLCSEDLSGHLPGRHGLCRYAAAPRIMATIAETARQRFGDKPKNKVVSPCSPTLAEQCIGNTPFAGSRKFCTENIDFFISPA